MAVEGGRCGVEGEGVWRPRRGCCVQIRGFGGVAGCTGLQLSILTVHRCRLESGLKALGALGYLRPRLAAIVNLSTFKSIHNQAALHYHHNLRPQLHCQPSREHSPPP
jgi:hypothetical protein